MPNQQYQPEKIDIPPLYAWPPRPVQTFKWLTVGLLYPWGMLYIGIALLTWGYLTVDISTMKNLEFGWIATIWLRNAGLLILVAGGLHWWYYIRQSQKMDTKFTNRWLAKDDDKFLWRDQVKDNMFWSLVSGVSIWTAYEALTYWWYANGYVATTLYSESPIYFVVMLWAVFFWSAIHFYLNHRALHWKPLYERAHELHHRNVNTGPWTGISMHPLEHLIYFSVFLLWWVIPVHPIHIILTGLFQGISPAVSHCGFDFLKLGKSFKIPTGDNFHNLHHRFFHINYGNLMAPLDSVFNSWHNGAESGKAVLTQRLRRRAL